MLTTKISQGQLEQETQEKQQDKWQEKLRFSRFMSSVSRSQQILQNASGCFVRQLCLNPGYVIEYDFNLTRVPAPTPRQH